MFLVADTNLASMICMAGVLLVSGILLMRSSRYFARQPRQASGAFSPAPRAPQEPAPHAEMPGKLGQWEVELHETARDLSARLDSKMSALQHLIREADRAAARLEAAIAAAERTQPQAHRAAESPDATPGAALDHLDIRPASQADALRVPRAATASDAAATAAEGVRPKPTAAERYEEIYVLSDYGYAAAEIAHRTGIPTGEVELILSLRVKR